MLVTSNIIHEKILTVKGVLAIICLSGMTARVLKRSMLPGGSLADACVRLLAYCKLASVGKLHV